MMLYELEPDETGALLGEFLLSHMASHNQAYYEDNKAFLTESLMPKTSDPFAPEGESQYAKLQV
ncbi:MAG: hypothetical protein H7070_14070 [Saprospiraceae bacterium]|nr:hypothetical protein [Pyrinomonadaceae bacterium]